MRSTINSDIANVTANDFVLGIAKVKARLCCIQYVKNGMIKAIFVMATANAVFRMLRCIV